MEIVSEAAWVFDSLTNVSTGHNNCIQLLAEDPQRERRRMALKKKRQAMIEGQACLDALDRKYQNVASSQPSVFANFSPTPLHGFGSGSSRTRSSVYGSSVVMDDMDVS